MTNSTEDVELSSLYTVNDDGSVTYKEGLGGSWRALAEAHYLASQNKSGNADD